MPSTSAWFAALLGAAAILTAGASAAAEPLTLAQALDRAQTGSPLITAAEAQVRAAEGRARQAGLGRNPEVSVEAENFSGSGPYRAFGGAETTVMVGQTLELGGKRRARAGVAKAEVEAARLKLTLARADLALEVRTTFAEAVAADDRLALARQAEERAQDLARVVGILVDAGREPPLRAMRAEAALDEARAWTRAAQTDAAAALRGLSLALGSEGEVNPAPEAIKGDAAPVGLIDPTASLDVRLADLERDIADATVDRERRAATPDLTIQAGVRRFEDTGDQAVILGFSAPIPVVDRNQGNVAAARAEAETAEARRRLALAQAVRRVRDAQSALAAAEAWVSVLEARTAPQAQEALRLVRLGYEAGKFPLIEVLDAQSALAATQEDLIAARLDRARAIAALTRAAAR